MTTRFTEQLSHILPMRISGRISRLVGLTAAVSGFPVPVGAIVRLEREHGSAIEGEVVGFHDQETLLLPYGDLGGIRRGSPVTLLQSTPGARVGDALLGRVINGRGRYIDGLPPAILPDRVPLHPAPLSPLERPRITGKLGLGLRAMDGLLTCGEGQRLGIFAGSGVGKSTLLGQIARSTTADVNVVVLIGERGREVREFIERDLGPEGLARSVVVVATGDDPALLRLRSAYLGTAIAEYFRDQGRNVLLMMDSVTRFALAQREIGLAAGEPPATRGYPPSVFALLPRLLERSGRNSRGSITGLYTVLVEGDDTNEPISDTVRGILDGHVVLSRRLAQQGHFPAIDVLASLSRLMSELASPEQKQAALTIRQLMAAYQQSEDLITIGAYQTGSNPLVDTAIQMKPAIDHFLKQRVDEKSSLQETCDVLIKLARLRDNLPKRTADPTPDK
ncbi:FliI/YscN family ATPase [bacterium]|nr:FliI/YscN family ATPase [bacterium]